MKKILGFVVLAVTLALFSGTAMNQPLHTTENLRGERVVLPPTTPVKGRMAQTERASAEAQLERVVKLFEAKQAWWQREFPKDAAPKAELSKVAREAGTTSAGALRERRASDRNDRSELVASARPAPSPAGAAAPLQATRIPPWAAVTVSTCSTATNIRVRWMAIR